MTKRIRGRAPEGPTLSELARAHTEAAIDALATVMKDGGSDAAKVSAANAILDRGWGRPRQEMEMDVDILDLAETIARRRRQVVEGR
ncbi:hypothetical protein GCM10009087_01790 [Sphingomonas oligophenolica]|uniref:Uncharacterized protein n=1 Tax=Sphingomonas oligophenolica TaxID=301154 RepID=A0ABU9Y0Y4_9SPHN